MKSCHLPRASFGTQTVPVVFLGDNGFIHGRHIPAVELRRLMGIAIKRIDIGLSGGTPHVLRAARSVLPPGCGAVMYHTDIRPRIDGVPLSYGRMLSTICEHLTRSNSRFLDEDDLVGRFYKKFAGYAPYVSGDTPTITIESSAVDHELRLVSTLRPNLVSVGGDWLDFLGSVGRADLIIEGLARWRRCSDTSGAALLLTTYTGQLTLHGVEERISPLVDGLLVTANRAGRGMFPDKKEFLSWVCGFGRPVMAMHAMGIGRVPPSDALAYVFEESPASAVVLGASRPQTIASLCDSLVHRFQEDGEL